MVFFMVFPARCNAKSSNTMNGRLVLSWYWRCSKFRFSNECGVIMLVGAVDIVTYPAPKPISLYYFNACQPGTALANSS